MRLSKFAPNLLWLNAAPAALAQNLSSSGATIFGSNGTITLKGNTTTPVVVLLDYGHNVEGFPTFEVLSASGDVEGLKIRYSETKAVLDSNPNVSHPQAYSALVLTSWHRAMVPPAWQPQWTRTV